MEIFKHFFQQLGDLLSIPWFFVILELVGTLAGAVSGARLSAAKQFDLFGAFIVGTATACGGGTIRLAYWQDSFLARRSYLPADMSLRTLVGHHLP